MFVTDNVFNGFITWQVNCHAEQYWQAVSHAQRVKRNSGWAVCPDNV